MSMSAVKTVCILLHLLNTSWAVVSPVKENSQSSFDSSKVIFAVNAGGGFHKGAYGIKYEEDKTTTGFSTHSGELLDHISNAVPEDSELYKTDRSGASGFGYAVPVKSDGNYVLVLKFVETSVNEIGKRMFQVALNDHVVLPVVDIVAKVGFGTVYQAVIAFSVADHGTTLELSGTDSSGIEDGSIMLEFQPIPGHDRPKVNAFYVFKGTASDVPPVPNKTDEFGKPKSKIVVAVNAGGEAYTDISGIHYYADKSKIGTASSYGMTLVRFHGVNPEDEILYRTERYHVDSFSYKIPVQGDGSYVLVLKFSEVWFTAAGQKIFDVALNGKHTVVSNLDIYDTVGFATAHDEIVSFQVTNGGKRLKWNQESSAISNKQISIEFRKGPGDNPKVNAFYVLKGTLEDIPRQPSFESNDPVVPEKSIASEELDIDWDVMDEGNFPAADEISSSWSPSRVNHNDPWENESLLTVAFPLILALLIGVAILGVMFVYMKSPLKSS